MVKSIASLMGKIMETMQNPWTEAVEIMAAVHGAKETEFINIERKLPELQQQ